MTEAEWLDCNDPLLMFALFEQTSFLDNRASHRKLSLWSAVCLRRSWSLLTDERSRNALEVVERYVDGYATEEEKSQALSDAIVARDKKRELYEQANATHNYNHPTVLAAEALEFAAGGIVWVLGKREYVQAAQNAWFALALGHVESDLDACNAIFDSEQFAQTMYLRDIVGSPFCALSSEPAWLEWNDGTISKLAQSIYKDRELPSGHLDAARLRVLADALEEAGCRDEAILAHCRVSAPHVRGCWVVDLLLGKD